MAIMVSARRRVSPVLIADAGGSRSCSLVHRKTHMAASGATVA